MTDAIVQSKTTTLSQIAREARNRVLEAQREAESAALKLETLAHDWPAHRPVVSAHDLGTSGLVSVRAEVETRVAAWQYLAAFPLAPLTYMRGTFTSLHVKAWQSERQLARVEHEISDIWPVKWVFEPAGASYHRAAELEAYAEIAGVRVWLKVSIHHDGAFLMVQHEGVGRNKRITGWTVGNAPAGEVIRYASGSHDTCGQTVVYFPREGGGAEPTPETYLTQERSIVRTRGY